MLQQSPVEVRLAALEQEVASLKRRLFSNNSGNWIDRISGSMADMPEFDEVLELGRKIRHEDVDPSQRTP